ncbi:MFS general substrate transporter [Polychaeton citri CBS 116435]|uniref:MFS general substrate transporter n=1 Tax=Polychaeton citri CBS 116435 TaxID=1314669 RepID=A0A9P4Q7B0_9PEZI|nr:MFS general substrate transporter [Polychaeton citri CBS 116435]
MVEVLYEESKSSWYLFLLALTYGGLQFSWSVELAYGSPFLLSLGISKSLLAFVWIAGPLSGTLVQPYIGIRSDKSRSRFGKRRPFMIGGAIATAISLMLLAWTVEIVSGFLHACGVAKDSHGTKIAAIVFAVLMIYVLDFSLNVIQAGCRAFIVDRAPTHQQDDANAWAARLGSIGNILGYLAGYVNLPRHFWWLGSTQFKVLCAFACFCLAVTVTLSCMIIGEEDARLEGQPREKEGLFTLFAQLWRSVRKLPLQVKRVCIVQFFAWIGWFPYLFYLTTYVGELHVDPIFRRNPHMTDEEIDAAWNTGTRLGTLALFIFAVATFAASIGLPFIVASMENPPTGSDGRRTHVGLRVPNLSRHTSTAVQHNSRRTSDSHCGRFKMPSLEIRWLTLRRVWFLSHLLFALLMWLTFAVKTTLSATILAAFVGIPWAVTNWVPFALIAAEISRRDVERQQLRRASHISTVESLADTGVADKAGVVLGIHNVAIAAPQVIATLVSSLIFRFLQRPRGSMGDNSVAWVLRFGGVCALIAAWMTRRVFEDARRGR